MQCINMHAQDDGIDIRSVPSLEISPLPHDPKLPCAKYDTCHSCSLFARMYACLGGEVWGGGSNAHGHVCPFRLTDRQRGRTQGDKASRISRPLPAVSAGPSRPAHISTGMYI